MAASSKSRSMSPCACGVREFWLQDSGFKFQGLGFMVYCLRFRVQDFGFRGMVQGLGFRGSVRSTSPCACGVREFWEQDSGFRVPVRFLKVRFLVHEVTLHALANQHSLTNRTSYGSLISRNMAASSKSRPMSPCACGVQGLNTSPPRNRCTFL